jgi:transcription antitermination factor NusG
MSRSVQDPVPPEPAEVRGEDFELRPQWFAFRTRARCEKQVVRLLTARGVEAEGAIAWVDRQWSDRVRRVGQPLFPGYVFARFPLPRLLDLLPTPGIVHLVRIQGEAAPLREEEIESVRALVRGISETGQLPVPEDFLEVGQEIEVIEGPFKGMTGLLLEQKGSRRVAVRLEALRQAVSVELPRSKVRSRNVAG